MLFRVVGDVAVGVVFAAVPDEVQRHLALLLRQGSERHDLGGVDDAAGQARLHGLVQEHRVQDHARCRVQAEGHVRDAERVWMPGYFVVIWRMASMVSMPSRRVSS